jgi:hypothetical protein
MDWSVTYWHHDETITIASWEGNAWHDLPETGVLWVDCYRDGYRHRMQGYDYYWVLGERFGCFNDPDSRFGDGYAGACWECDWNQTWTDREPPAYAHIIAGIMLPDATAAELGLL